MLDINKFLRTISGQSFKFRLVFDYHLSWMWYRQCRMRKPRALKISLFWPSWYILSLLIITTVVWSNDWLWNGLEPLLYSFLFKSGTFLVLSIHNRSFMLWSVIQTRLFWLIKYFLITFYLIYLFEGYLIFLDLSCCLDNTFCIWMYVLKLTHYSLLPVSGDYRDNVELFPR